MPVSKIKNLILLILALSVVCLLFLAVPMRTAQIQAEDALHAQLEELFASYDIQLDRGILPRSVDLYTVELSGQQADNAAAAAALLGAPAGFHALCRDLSFSGRKLHLPRRRRLFRRAHRR